MATLMITGGKVGRMIGRRVRCDRLRDLWMRVADHGACARSAGADLRLVLPGGVGAALIMPAIVALVALNFRQSSEPVPTGLVASAGAIAVAAGTLIGGAGYHLPRVADLDRALLDAGEPPPRMLSSR